MGKTWEEKRFPKSFLWGAATAAHQVEGGNRNNDWWQWEHGPGRIYDGGKSGDAAGWWRGEAEADLKRAADMGHGAHRFSLEWSRLEPEPGRYDDAAFERYAEILSSARDLGLSTNVTLYHFTLPSWAAERGSWLDPELPERFGRFAAETVRRLAPFVDHWGTINEPNVLAYSSYMAGLWPPGGRSMLACMRVLRALLRAHRLAYWAIREIDDAARVGIVLNLPLFEPHRADHAGDRLAAGLQDWTFSGMLLAALDDGGLRLPLTLAPRRDRDLADAFDWLGLNYYGRFEVRFDVGAETPLGRHVQDPTTRTEQTDWGQICPRGLTDQLLRVGALGKPVFVTENGLFDNSDTKRPAFLADHVSAVHEAIRRGVDVRGYFHWSLVDNFEWAEGWATHFGLLELDRETGERRPRRSAEVYSTICRANGIPEGFTSEA